MKLTLEALIDDAANEDDNANNTDANDTNDNDNNNAYDNNDKVGSIGVVGVVINNLCFGSTGLYWSYLEGGPCKTKG